MMYLPVYLHGLLLLAMTFAVTPASASTCPESGVQLQVLGSGGPELDDGRASTSYLLWLNGKARILIDMGSGSLQHFEQSGADINDLDMVLFTHLHVDHSNDLPALIKATYFTGRDRDLPIYGPDGNHLMPSTNEYVEKLMGTEGAYRYLSDYLDGSESYRLLPRTIKTKGRSIMPVLETSDVKVTTIPIHHGPIPSLAWRLDIGNRSIAISGDMSNLYETLPSLAKDADLLVAHHAIPETAKGVARRLHMPPSEIGKIAQRANVKHLLLSHRMNRTLGREKESTAVIRKHYQDDMTYAEDMQCYAIR